MTEHAINMVMQLVHYQRHFKLLSFHACWSDYYCHILSVALNLSKQSWVFILTAFCSLWYVQIIRYIKTLRSYSILANYTSPFSSLSRGAWQHWIHKMLVKYILLSVCLRWNQLSLLPRMQYKGVVCYQLTHLSSKDLKNTCTSS